FFKTLADGDDGVFRDKLIDAHLPRAQVTKYSSPKPFFVDDPGRGESSALWRFDPLSNADYSNPVQISVSDPYLLRDVPVGQLTATGKGIRPTKLSVNLDGAGTGYQAELKRVILSLEDVYFPGIGGVPGGPGDDDGNGIANDDGEWGFPGSNDILRPL